MCPSLLKPPAEAQMQMLVLLQINYTLDEGCKDTRNL